MDSIERSGCQEVEGARDPQVDFMVLERLVGVVSDVEPDRVRPEPQEQPAHRRFELRGLSTRDRRPAGARPTGDIEYGLAARCPQRAEGVHQAGHELRHDRCEVRLRRDLRCEPMLGVQLPEGTAQKRSVRGCPAERDQGPQSVSRRPTSGARREGPWPLSRWHPSARPIGAGSVPRAWRAAAGRRRPGPTRARDGDGSFVG